MAGLDHVEAARLREWLSEVREGETTAALMLAVAYDKGIGAGGLAERPVCEAASVIRARAEKD